MRTSLFVGASVLVIAITNLFQFNEPNPPNPQHIQSGLIKKAPKISFEQKEVKCLTDNIYYEASHEPVLGKKAVGLVTLNRVKHSAFKPKTVCGVVYQSARAKTGKKVCQFSWTCGVKKKFNRVEYQSAQVIATNLYKNRKHLKDFTNGSTHFHAGSLTWPQWTQELQYTTDIGGHVFYKIPTRKG